MAVRLKHDVTDDDLFSHLMYPEVHAEFARLQREHSDVSVLPTPTFFYGLQQGEEVSVSIEEGKTLFVKLINVGPPDKDGRRTVLYELNGVPRETSVLDRSVQAKVKAGSRLIPPLPFRWERPFLA